GPPAGCPLASSRNARAAARTESPPRRRGHRASGRHHGATAVERCALSSCPGSSAVPPLPVARTRPLWRRATPEAGVTQDGILECEDAHPQSGSRAWGCRALVALHLAVELTQQFQRLRVELPIDSGQRTLREARIPGDALEEPR